MTAGLLARMTAFQLPNGGADVGCVAIPPGRQPLQEREDFGVPASFRGVAHEVWLRRREVDACQACSTVAAESAGGRCDAARWRS
jgi:hypothetical protein